MKKKGGKPLGKTYQESQKKKKYPSQNNPSLLIRNYEARR